MAPACSALPNSRADPNSRCLDNFKRHFLAFKLGLDGLSVVGAFEAEAEKTFGHFGAPGVEHGDEGRGVGLPGHGDAVLDFEADFLARELELAHGVAHERLDAEIFGDFGVKGDPVAGFLGDGELVVGEGLHDEEIRGNGDGSGRDGELDGFARARLFEDFGVVCGDGGRDLFVLLAELGAGGAEVELDLVVERARGAGIEDVDGLDVEVILEDVLETPCGLEADVVGPAENHFAQRLADFEFLGFSGREGESGEGLDGVHLVEEKHVDFGVIGLGVAFEVDGLPGVIARASDEVLVHRVGEERQDRGDEPGEGFEAFKEGFKGGAGLDGVVLFDFPEPLPVVSYVPNGEVFDEFLDIERGLPDKEGLKPGATFLAE